MARVQPQAAEGVDEGGVDEAEGEAEGEVS